MIVTAIESGHMETQVCILADSIRRFGGALASAPILAVVPRPGMPLQRFTVETLKRLKVELATAERRDSLSWFGFLNKSTAIKFATKRFDGTIIWLDADVLALDEPSELLINGSSTQFAACCTDVNIGTSRDDDASAPYFKECCRVLGVDYDSLPYLTTKMEGVPIRGYWNSGIFAFERSTGLGETFDEFIRLLLKHKIGSHVCDIFFTDQVSLGLAVHKLGLTYRELPLNHNCHIQPDSVLKGDIENVFAANPDIRLLHYHGCLWPASFDRLCRQVPDEVADMLRSYGPLDSTSFLSRLGNKAIKTYRARKQAAFVREVRLV